MGDFTNKLQFILIAGLIIMSGLFFRQCESTNEVKSELNRTLNNQLALSDTIKNYKDKLGNSVGTKRALELKLEELGDSLEFERSKPPITIIRSVTNIKDSIIEVPVKLKNDSIKIDTYDTWGRSLRTISLSLPYEIVDSTLVTGSANILLEQRIWLEASLVREESTNDIYVNLKTDYPGVTFNSSQGILISNNDRIGSELKYESRKSMGVGLVLGYGFSWGTARALPIIGVGVYYSPKFLQW